MAKKRLVDFRGGVNQKISPHMIGDSQGQSAQDVDLSAVRLQGRRKQNINDQADGDFFYSYGNNTDGRWVSTDPTDTLAHITDATDFEVWNRDLYVARHNEDGSGNSSDGTILRFLDGATSASQSLTLNAPGSFNLTEDYAYQTDSASFVASTVDSNRGGKGKQLKAAVAGQAYVPSQTSTSLVIEGNNIYNVGGTFAYILSSNQWLMWSSSSQPAAFSTGNFGGTAFPLNTWLTLYGDGDSPPRSSPNSTTYYELSYGNFWKNGQGGSDITANNGSHSVTTNFGMTGNTTGRFMLLGGSTTSYQSANNNWFWRILVELPTGVTFDFTPIGLTSGTYYASHVYGGASLSYLRSSNVTTTTAEVPLIAATPLFNTDDARHFIYRQFTSADGATPSWNTDTAEGAGGGGTPWLGSPTQPRLQNASAHGYYLTAIVGQSGTNLPEESQDKTKATPSSSNSVFGTDAVATPNQLVFSSIAATNPTAACYRLLRVDTESTESNPISLGFILPNQSESFSVSGDTVTLTLPTSVAAGTPYKLNWTAYQNTKVTFVVASTTHTARKSTGTVGVDGIAFNKGDTISITLSDNPGDNSDFRGVDFWLERRVLTGSTSAVADTYAVVKCFQYFKNDDTNIANIEEECDFLDVFSSGLSSGSISGSGNLTAPPDNLKFLKESNNFFFAVGTEETEAGRYGGTVDLTQNPPVYTANPEIGNKADSFLFVSTYNNPRDWPIDAYVEFDASITGLATYPGELIVFTENGVYRVTGSRANQMRKAKLATTEGLQENQNKTIALVDNYLVWVSQSGICFYNGSTVTNLTKGRFEDFTLGQSVAGQLDGKYYVVQKSNEIGYVVDFTLEGFPVSSVDLSEDRNFVSNAVLHYVPSRNKLYSRHGFVEGSTDRNTFDYKTREFDGGAFGSLKLVKSVTVNGSGTGNIQVYLDGQPVYSGNGFEYDFTGQTYLRKEYSTAFGTIYNFYYNGVLIRSFGGSYIPHSTETGSLTEGSTWTIGEGVAPDANGPAWNVTFESTSRYTNSVTSGNPVSMTFTYNYYGVRNNLLVTKKITLATGYGNDQPARVYLPASRSNNPYGLSVADVWSVEITDWNGKIDWIDTEYEVLTD